MAEAEIVNIQENLRISCNLIDTFKKILNAKVLNFFVDQVWSSSVPCSWQTLEQIDLEKFSYLLADTNEPLHSWPLSILALKVLLKKLNLSRVAASELTTITVLPSVLTHPRLRSHFNKNLKPKKKHEIEIVGRHIERQLELHGNNRPLHIVDFGSGLGHLCRHLAFGYRLPMCGIEMQSDLVEQALRIDERMAMAFKKALPHEPVPVLPKYLNIKIFQETDPKELVQLLKATFKLEGSDDFACGFVGLHPCGDLGVILMTIFLACPEIKFLSFAGCCYMKITAKGYPLSSFVRQIPNSQLTYEMLEVACHAIEKYSERLHVGDYNGLRIHSYRAAIETIIVKHWPDLKLSGLASLKYTDDLSFKAYCTKAVSGLNIKIDDTDIESKEVTEFLAGWRQVVVFHTFRLMLAPLVETVLLHDRLLYLKEQLPKGCCEIKALFDATLSPRNHLVTAWKR